MLIAFMLVIFVGGQALALQTVVGSTEVYLDAVRENIRTKETTMGNLIIDALRSETGAQVGFTNGGGIREALEPGPITLENILAVLPFENSVVTIELTGAEIWAAIEHGVGQYPATWGGFLHVSNLRYIFDPSKPAGERVVTVLFKDKEIDLEATFIVVTNGFLTSGGDGFEMLKKETIEEFGDMQEVLISYLRKHSPVAPKLEGRITALQEPHCDGDCDDCN